MDWFEWFEVAGWLQVDGRHSDDLSYLEIWTAEKMAWWELCSFGAQIWLPVQQLRVFPHKSIRVRLFTRYVITFRHALLHHSLSLSLSLSLSIYLSLSLSLLSPNTLKMTAKMVANSWEKSGSIFQEKSLKLVDSVDILVSPGKTIAPDSWSGLRGGSRWFKPLPRFRHWFIESVGATCTDSTLKWLLAWTWICVTGHVRKKKMVERARGRILLLNDRLHYNKLLELNGKLAWLQIYVWVCMIWWKLKLVLFDSSFSRSGRVVFVTHHGFWLVTVT